MFFGWWLQCTILMSDGFLSCWFGRMETHWSYILSRLFFFLVYILFSLMISFGFMFFILTVLANTVSHRCHMLIFCIWSASTWNKPLSEIQETPPSLFLSSTQKMYPHKKPTSFPAVPLSFPCQCWSQTLLNNVEWKELGLVFVHVFLLCINML